MSDHILAAPEGGAAGLLAGVEEINGGKEDMNYVLRTTVPEGEAKCVKTCLNNLVSHLNEAREEEEDLESSPHT